MELNFLELLDAVEGELLVEKKEKSFNKLSTDTRKIEKDNIFLAIKGENFNGNKYVEEAMEKGASIAIVDEIHFDIKSLDGKITVIKVEDTLESLLKLASFYRKKLGVKVVAVTGSCGKTSTKDLIAGFLSYKYKVFKTKGNFNNQIGLPLMILELDSTIDVAVLEMGMSDLGEIHLLAETAKPDIAVITNIGLSHIENLKTQDNIMKAKLEVTDFFNKNNLLIVNGEDERLQNLSNRSFKVSKIGYNHEYDVYATNIILEENQTSFDAHIHGESHTFILEMPGKHNVLNAMLAIRVAKELEVSLEDMYKGIANIESTSMRLQVIKKDKITIINDCYNASPDSMKSSLDVLNMYNNSRRVAILGTMNELGEESETAHKNVGEYAIDKVDLLIAIGSYSQSFKNGFKGETIEIYDTKEEFLNNVQSIIKENDIILVKASRGMKFEDIVNSLEEISI
ncbi:UDP-N-acetylmuramoyl-tripeptide--D-alanyl-D-alanine ligase [Clostridium septicum]|uniref:UDP-N-acetylmuramoyl-tripeptide--D-alanyl-D-alanine ligase n=1 Tax=Clostridium septicum TaxID=1504 RepID=A0A9N7JMT5_CLOSE|nr:UDP-N-acetylmuramoyl-tripeptide--D-alanyl-D-alanine ligase [Clostridium septicum]AYE35609.1 UDP-N-acetylmuramoyl-tripeptide--D-alanyl-D-alanine ligase [Clostridium septicum]MDU1313205.1 UDP-N-acetylmuramoyl-tripeptide--D-alanyl-D-alanine ligase [Clostridium septicum]QAS60996.1 UDP-N-acetylmuramoyl-tripeptide--D-alanyl-D-alanine ligase [Clostridium septicum]UEC19725.1 UDP-N-acetylmuramoyl-tripeptide--D-alanyl-D-alanine ligase [Clostridium septicum]USS02214.1 UDP-N-acetylmuramoyl-tripeptide--